VSLSKAKLTCLPQGTGKSKIFCTTKISRIFSGFFKALLRFSPAALVLSLQSLAQIKMEV
jgi:hypothetical protein